MRARFVRIAVVTLSAALAACGHTDSPMGVSRPAVPTGAASHLLLSSATTVTPLARTTPLAAPITVTKTIGLLGGTIAIPQAGVTVVVPSLALTSPTTISVTALAGSNVAYEFAPHGITFNVPLVMTQSLVGTQAASGGSVNPLSLFVGYFPNSSNTTSVTELLGVNLNLLGQVATTTLWHFSGYIYASGCDDGF